MIDKGKYASHGTFIKRLSSLGMVQWNKPKASIINPLPTNKSRATQLIHSQHCDIQVSSQQFPIKFKFEQKIIKKIIPQELVQPFLYIEKLIPKKRQIEYSSQPFITSSSNRTKTTLRKVEIPQGYNNLYQYERDRHKIAQQIFNKIIKAQITDLKQAYLLHTKQNQAKKQSNSALNVSKDKFKHFMKDLLPNVFSQQQLIMFFRLYCVRNKETKSQLLSMKAFCFNYQKYRKKEVEITNIISKKAAKERYTYVKQYFQNFDKTYKNLKKAMNALKDYEQQLRNHLNKIYQSYENPYLNEIQQINAELALPLTKYDKNKKMQLQMQIEKYTNDNNEQFEQRTKQFDYFMQLYSKAIISNHDLFFTKRTVCNLLLPLLYQHDYLKKQVIEKQVVKMQNQKQMYLECLSEVVVEIERDKKCLGENYFTLAEMVELVLMRDRKKINQSQFTTQFTINALKKLIRQIKRQFLLKFSIHIQNLEQFIPEQQIPINILRICFEMQCTKVLFQNQIWTELLNMIPQQQQISNYHQQTICINTCLEYVKKYTHKLDQQINIEFNKSKHISLLTQSANLNNLVQLSNVIQKVINELHQFRTVDDNEQQHITTDKKKVSFADVVQQSSLQQNKNHKEISNQLIGNFLSTNNQKQEFLANSILKSIHAQESVEKPKRQPISSNIPEDLSHLKTLAKSFFIPDTLNTNAFDIRFYQKIKQEQEKEQFIRMGNSMLLSNLPKIEEIQSEDPLRISRFLLKNINNTAEVEKKVVKEKQVDHNIKEGIAHHYYRQKIALENKPTIIDAQGNSKYSVMMPVSYYQGYLADQNEVEKDQWYIRPHHVETLTENPLSKKDNLIKTEYQSKVDKISLKKRPQEFIIEENVSRKEGLIESLEERIGVLKNQINSAQRSNKIKTGMKVPTGVLNEYFEKITDEKSDKDLQIAAYEGVLYDLRRKQRNLLNDYRQNQNYLKGYPEEKWWERKDSQFNNELRKERLLVADSLKTDQPHSRYVHKLQNQEIY